MVIRIKSRGGEAAEQTEEQPTTVRQVGGSGQARGGALEADIGGEIVRGSPGGELHGGGPSGERTRTAGTPVAPPLLLGGTPTVGRGLGAGPPSGPGRGPPAR